MSLLFKLIINQLINETTQKSLDNGAQFDIFYYFLHKWPNIFCNVLPIKTRNTHLK